MRKGRAGTCVGGLATGAPGTGLGTPPHCLVLLDLFVAIYEAWPSPSLLDPFHGAVSE